VCYWGRRSGLQEADVADLSQEVFALLHQKLPDFQYDASKSFRNWLRTVTLNKLRELRRRRGVPLLGNDALLANVAEPDSGDESWDQEHNRYLAARALQLMQTDFDRSTWQACWETVVANRSPAEVARELGLSTGAVYAAKSRILRRLRKELEGLL
jgi:RNA polymerase sigma-70 factor (ECF subfamily)